MTEVVLTSFSVYVNEYEWMTEVVLTSFSVYVNEYEWMTEVILTSFSVYMNEYEWMTEVVLTSFSVYVNEYEWMTEVVLTSFSVYVNEYEWMTTAHVQPLNCCVKKCQNLLRQTCGLRTAQISVLWIARSGLSCSIVSTRDKSIVWMNWDGSLSMSDVVFNRQFLTRLLTCSKEDFERMSVLKEDTLSTACERTILTLSISVTFSVTCLTVASLIMK